MCLIVNYCSFVIFLTFITVNAEELQVETTHGVVEGKLFETFLEKVQYHGYLGIPYAAPPLKDSRFLPPQPLEPWKGVLSAKKEKKPCIQYNHNVLKGQPLGWYGVEDCLYLDIFTPEPKETLFPVIVFLYNTHFQNSYNKTKTYSPDFFIEENVIVVTLEHRLSVTGFVSMEDEIVPGNAGLKDIVAALEWIKDNIDRFGGDADRITLMGSRGGATAVDLLMHSNAKNIFSAAILQGETSWASVYLQEEVKERAYKLAELLERASSSNLKLLKELNDLPVSDLLSQEIQSAPPDYYKENQRGIITFAPIVEKQPNGLITEYPERSQEKIDIPIMVGYNSQEGYLASFQYLEEPRYLSFVEKDFPLYLPIRVNFRFDPVKDICDKAVDDIKGFYYKKGKVTIRSLEEHIRYLGDILSVYPVYHSVKAYSKRTTNSIYNYYFDYFSDLNENKNSLMKLLKIKEGKRGAASGDELCYLFYCPDLQTNYIKHSQSNTEAILLLKKMVKLWTNFAKYGNPTPDEDPALDELKWPSYDLEDKQYLHIGSQLEVKSDLNKESIEFWDDFIKKWEHMAVDGVITGSSDNDENKKITGNNNKENKKINENIDKNKPDERKRNLTVLIKEEL